MKCSNNNCHKSTDTLNAIHIGEGDFVCSKKCEEEYIKKREEFFNNIHDDNFYNQWMDNQFRF